MKFIIDSGFNNRATTFYRWNSKRNIDISKLARNKLFDENFIMETFRTYAYIQIMIIV